MSQAAAQVDRTREQTTNILGPTATGMGNRTLVRVVIAALGAAITGIAILVWLPAPWARPGSALLQSAAIAGSLFLVASFVTVHGKRLGAPGRRALRAHIALAAIGVPLVSVHSTGSFLHPPALLLAALVGLIALGLWARTAGARRMALTFGTKRSGFEPPQGRRRAELAALLERKRALLRSLDPNADEAVFALRPGHWRRRPGAAWRFRRAERAESRLVGTRASVGAPQAHWRMLHQGLAWGFVLGLVVHVFLVTFFAAYVAEGREIYWWHVTDWNF